MGAASPVRALLLSAGLAIALVGCDGMLPPAGAKLLGEVEQAYQDGDDATAIVRADRFLLSYNGTNAAGEAYYLRGLAHARRRERDLARRDFEQALQRAHRKDLAPLTQVALGNLDFEQWKLGTAAEHYRVAVEQLPNEPPKDLVLYRLGLCEARLGHWAQARNWFSQVMHLFSHSAVEPAARRYAAADAFTVQCGAYSDWRNADRQVRMLKERNLPAERRMDSHGRYHLVQVGRYPRYQEARTALAKVRGLVPTAIIVP